MEKIKRHLFWILPTLIFLTALAFRTYKLFILPAGLFPDEAANGLDINLMEQGHLQPFYERGNGREALFFYMLWGSVKIFGRTPFAHHLVSGLVGTLAVIACYFVTREIFKLYTTRYALYAISVISAFLMAVSSWHVVLSRTAFRANLIPLLSALTLWAMLKIVTSSKQQVTSKRNPDAKSLFAIHPPAKAWHWRAGYSLFPILFGIFFALGFYTYIAFRIMIPLVGILILWPTAALLLSSRATTRDLYLISNSEQKSEAAELHTDNKTKNDFGSKLKILFQNFWKPFLIAAVSFVIVISPLAHYFYTHPGSFVGRSGQVSVFNVELNHGNLIGTIWQVSKDSILAYFTHGDVNWRHNISGFPFLSPFISPFFAIGLILCLLFAIRYTLRPIRYRQNYPEFLLTGWFFAMLLPVIMTAEGIPHGLRSIGTIPVVFIITAYGMIKVYEWVISVISRSPSGTPNSTSVIPALSSVIPAEAGIHKKLKKSKISELEHEDMDPPAVGGTGGQPALADSLVVSGVTKKIILALSCGYLLFLLIALPLQTYHLYFVTAANSSEYYEAFRGDLTVVSEYLKQNGNKETTYLILDKFSVQTTDYLTTKVGKTACDRDTAYRPNDCIDDASNKPYTQVDPEDSWLGGMAPSPSLSAVASAKVDEGRAGEGGLQVKDNKPNPYIYGFKKGDEIIFTQTSLFDIKKFKQYHPNVKLKLFEKNNLGKYIMAVYVVQ